MTRILALVFAAFIPLTAIAADDPDSAPEALIRPAGDSDLSEFLWTNRPVVVFSDSPSDPRYQEQIELLAERPDMLRERDVVVLTDTDPAARSPVRRKLRPRGFQLVLLDKDGRLKLFDIVAANPPFSLDKWGHDTASDDPHGRFRRGIPPKTKGDYAFISHMVETLKPGTGRMGVVVPHGVLFRGSSEGKIRQKLIEENLLDSVIGLPEKLFYGTGIPAAILIFRQDKKDDNVLFIDASREYQAGKNQNALSEDNIRKVIETYQARKDVDKYAHVASLEEIKENDFNLNIPRYVDTFEEEEEIDLVAVRMEREKLKEKLEALELEMDGYLKELGYGS